MKKRKHDYLMVQGFSIVEVLTVLFIIGVLIGLSAPYFGKSKKAIERHAAAKVIVSMIRQARQMATTRNAVYRVDFDASGWAVIRDEANNEVGKKYYLPEYIVFVDSVGKELDPQWDFTPQGHISTAIVRPIYIKFSKDTVNILYDRIDVKKETGQVNLLKDRSS